MSDAETTPAEEPTIEELQEKIKTLEGNLRARDQQIAAVNDALNKFRNLVTQSAQEHFQRAQEIMEVAEMRVQKAQKGSE